MFQKTPNKYGARKASYNGKMYHSGLEAGDALWLHNLEKEGTIRDLKEQIRYRIFHNGEHIVDSIVDFQFSYKHWLVWYETKGMSTDKYRVVRKLIEADLKSNRGEIYIVNAPSLLAFMRGRLVPNKK